MKVGFIGLGTMGGKIAMNAIKGGHELTVHDVASQVAKPLLDAGATWAETPAKVTAGVEVIMMSLPGPKEFEAVTLGPDGLIETVAPGQVILDLTTNSPTVVRRVAAEFTAKGAHLLDAPVSGGPSGAESGKMAVWVGGDAGAYEKALPVIRSVSDAPTRIGDVGSGSIAKLVHNLSGYLLHTALAETFTMGVKAGLDAESIWAAVREGALGRQRVFDVMAKQFLPGRFDPPDFALNLARKDVALACEVGREFEVPMRLSHLVLAEMTEAINKGNGARDSRTVMTLQEERAGVEVRVPKERLDAILDKG
jgi:3-hydroxyisobutyrate dehydrogenase